MDKLGWLPAGAHTGQFVKTASDAGLLPPECKPLGSDAFESGFPVDGGGTLQWSRGKEVHRGSDVHITIRFHCPDAGCALVEDRVVVLPNRWHCLGWVHGPDHGTACYRSAAACAAGKRSISRHSTPCGRRAGAAYCSPKTKRCFPDPWACRREAGGTLLDGGCVRADR